ncbi:MAG: sigma-70 family RNA polymerase sigma factor [Gammaproteobacteria bacterium]
MNANLKLGIGTVRSCSAPVHRQPAARRLQAADRKTLLHVLAENRSQFVRIAIEKVGCHYLAEDVVQQTTLKICETGLDRNIENPARYISRMVRNMAIDYARRMAREQRYRAPEGQLNNIASTCSCPEKTLEHCEALKVVRSALDALPARTRCVFELHRLHGIPQKGIATRIGVSPTLVNFMVRDAHRHCREQLRRYEASDGKSPHRQ